MIYNKLISIYADYQKQFDGLDFLSDRLVLDKPAKLEQRLLAVVLGEAPGREEYEQELPFV